MKCIDYNLFRHQGYVESYLDINEIICSLMAYYDCNNVVETILTPNKLNHNLITLSSVFGLNSFPLHSDGANLIVPPMIIIIENISFSDIKTKTIIHHLEYVINNQELINMQLLVKHNRADFISNFYTQRSSDICFFRWNELVTFLIEKNNINLIEFLKCDNSAEITWEQGKKLIINNWMCLHGRNAVLFDDLSVRSMKRFSLFKRI